MVLLVVFNGNGLELSIDGAACCIQWELTGVVDIFAMLVLINGNRLEL